MVDDEIVTFAGTRFRVVVESPTYSKLVPVDDPEWFQKYLDANWVELPGKKTWTNTSTR